MSTASMDILVMLGIKTVGGVSAINWAQTLQYQAFVIESLANAHVYRTLWVQNAMLVHLCIMIWRVAKVALHVDAIKTASLMIKRMSHFSSAT